MKLDGLTHPKTKELALSLDVALPHAVGLLEFLWAFVAQQTPRGNVGKWSNGVIAQEAQWSGDADEFVSALVSAGFLDESDEHRLVVHDWSEHAPNWVHSKLKRKGQRVISSDLSADIRSESRSESEGTQEATTSLAKSSQAKSSQAKSSQAKSGQGRGRASAQPPADADDPPNDSKGVKKSVRRPEWADPQVWADWKATRKSKLTLTAWTPIENQINAGIESGHDPNDMLRAAIERGWTGLKLDWYENHLRRDRGGAAESAVDRATREAIEYRKQHYGSDA